MKKVEILASVGSEGKNKPIDVGLIQSLLVKYFSNEKNRSSNKDTATAQKKYAGLIVNGWPTDHLTAAIKLFQKEALNTTTPDGRVDPNGKTFRKLIQVQSSKPQKLMDAIFGIAPVHTGLISTIPTAHLKSYFRKHHGLTISKGEDLNVFFEKQKNDINIRDIRWVAYILATAYHETTFSFKPKKESGEGKGYKYGKEIEVTDTKGIRGMIGAKYKNIYYGRGYVQITWDYNYKSLGKAIGMADKLYINPDLALKADTAYKIASHGMKNGSFTGKKLSDYIGPGKTDYENARRVINGTDHHTKIAVYAESMEILLRLSACPISGLR